MRLNKSIIILLLAAIVATGISLATLVVTNNKSFDKDPEFYKSLGNQMVKEGKVDTAIKAYEASLALADDDNVRSNLAILYYQKGSYDNAIAHLRVLIAEAKLNPSYHYDLAVNLVDKFRNTEDKKLADLYEAVDEYKAAEQLSPGFLEAENNINVLTKILSGE